MCRRVSSRAALGLAALLGWLPTAAAGGEEWSGSVGLSYVGSSSSGSEASFRTQTGLGDGLLLDELELRHPGAEGSSGLFVLEAYGFGDASPTERARLRWDLESRWSFRLGYDKRESFFSLAETELGRRLDRWDLARWRGSATWDGWRAARLSLDLRHTARDGRVSRPLYALNELYPLEIELDERMSEVGLRLETRRLPVKLIFEQAYASYVRENRRAPGGSTNLEGDDPDLLVKASTTRKDEQEIPTSRLTVTYGNPRLEAAGTLLVSPGDLDTSGLTSTAFDVDGGRVGRLELIDDLLGRGDLDTVAGNLRLGLALAPRWTLRLLGEYRDASTDVRLLGTRLLRATNPLGQSDLPFPLEEASRFDVTDGGGRLEIEWSDGRFTAWAGGFTASRDVAWQIGLEEERYEAQRDTDGAIVGLAYRAGGDLRLSAEYEHGSFDRFVFRTDPETVGRLTLKLASGLGGGWRIDLSGRFEESDNAQPVSSLDHSSDSAAAALSWSTRRGDAGFGFDLDLTDLTTRTALVLPGGEPGLSLYDLELLTTGVHGHVEAGRLRLDGLVSRIDDGGGSWPLEAWTARAGLAIGVAERTEVTLLGEYWSYDEERSELDDYDVTRYGVGLRWRFE